MYNFLESETENELTTQTTSKCESSTPLSKKGIYYSYATLSKAFMCLIKQHNIS